MSLWVDKYRPKATNELIGQAKNVARIKSWLRNYEPSQSRPIFIYGPPGIGKTTAAHLCCQESGYKTIEFNASDQRNKNIIKDLISTISSTSRLDFTRRASETKDVIILDEVDGMAGNEDRGGIAQLIIELKNTKKPMMFICNDGQHLKLRSLKEKCDVIEFRRPEPEAIRTVVTKIAQSEGIPISKINFNNLAVASDFDIRQIINSLCLFKEASTNQINKVTRMNPFEATKKVFRKDIPLEDRFECFFSDYNIMPLFVFENYVKNQMSLKTVSKIVESFCFGDLVEKEIRSNQNWSLLNVHGLYSTVIPSKLASKSDSGISVSFPQFLGKLSSTNKRMRLFQELNSHTCLSGKLDADSLDVMRERLGSALMRKDIDSAVDFMYEYNLIRDDLDSIMELSNWSFKPDLMSKIDSKTKTSFTNAYKKRSVALPYFNDDKVTKKKKAFVAGDYDEDEEDEEKEKDDDIVIKPKRVIKGPAKEATSEAPKGKGSKAKGVSKTSKDDIEGKKDTKNSKITQKSEPKKQVSSGEIAKEKVTNGNGNSKPDKRPLDGGIARFFNAKKPKS